MIEIRYLIRRILGDHGIRTVRLIASHIYKYLGVKDKPSKYREFGVSAVIWSRNEEEWIEASMRSVKEIVDEYVLIDSSTDRTPEIAREVGRELGIPVKIVKTSSRDMAHIGNLGLKHSKYRWILKWDPDFIMHEKYIDLIKKIIEDLDSDNWYYAVYWPHICLDGDLRHYNPKNYLHIEHWLFNYSPDLKYVCCIKGFLEHLIVPIYYRRIDIRKPLSFHLRTVKKPIRLLYRYYWYYARVNGILEKIDLDKFVREKIIEDFGTSDIVEASRKYLQTMLKDLEIYDPEKIHSYPKILEKYLDRYQSLQNK